VVARRAAEALAKQLAEQVKADNFRDIRYQIEGLIMVKKILLPKFAQEMQMYGKHMLLLNIKRALHEGIDMTTVHRYEKKCRCKGIEDFREWRQAVIRKIWLNHAKTN